MRKSLNGFIKTRHFSERQKERKISDQEILEAIAKGELKINDNVLTYFYRDIKVTVDHALERLITVHPKNPKETTTKMLKREEARKMREILNKKKPQESEDEFDKFIREYNVKKIK
jgi:hypothetical protein